MTTKDLRDIAAYWGANYALQRLQHDYTFTNSETTYDDLPADSEQIRELQSRVNSGLIYLLETRIDEVIAVKLHLRSLSSLTDEEVFTIADIAFDGEVDRRMCVVRRVTSDYYMGPILFGDYHLRSDGSSYHHDYWLSNEGLFGEGDGDEGNAIRTYNEAAVFAYLQSIGVYVPGTINAQYVQLL